VDRLLGAVISRAMRRGLRGEPVWLVLGVGAWLLRRARQRRDQTVWSGRIQPGQRLIIRALDPPEVGRGVSVEA